MVYQEDTCDDFNPKGEISGVIFEYVAYQSSITVDEISDLFLSSDHMDLVIAARKAYLFDEKFADRLLDLLDHEFYEVRSYASLSLGKIHFGEAIDKLTPLLFDEVEEVRFSAAEALGYFENEKIIIPLLKALADHSRETRRLATLSLDNQDGELLLQKVLEWIESISEEDYEMETEDAIIRIDVARGIMEACGEFQHEWTADVLKRGMYSPDLEMTRMAAISVGKQQHQQFLPRLLELHDHEDDDLRLGVIYALTELEFDTKPSLLFRHINDSYEFVRELLAGYIPRTYYNDHSKEVIEFFLTDQVPFVRSSLASALRSELYIDYLEILLHDDNSFVRKEAILALADIGSVAALRLLTDLEEEDDLVRIALDNSIGDIVNGLKIR